MGKPVIYIADFDKSSISFNGIRFYNDIRKNPNLHGFGNIMNSVKGLGSYMNIDKYTIDNYNNRINAKNDNKLFYYRLSRPGGTNLIFEFEQYYMRYGQQPYYTSFDMISLIFSFLYYRIVNGNELTPLFTLDYTFIKSNKALSTLFKKYMTEKTYTIIIPIYREQQTHYNGNFGKLLAPLIKSKSLDKLEFIHKFDKRKYFKPISTIYLTNDNYIALSLPIYPKLTQINKHNFEFLPDIDITEELYSKYTEKYTYVKSYIDYLKKHIHDFKIQYSGDYEVNKLIVKTNKYTVYTPLMHNFEWDYLTNTSIFNKFKKNIFAQNYDLDTILSVFQKLD
jgi:hypothetical protein